MTRSDSWLLLIASIGLGGCFQDYVPIGSDRDGGSPITPDPGMSPSPDPGMTPSPDPGMTPSPDPGDPAPEDGGTPGGESCGPTVCEAGLVCCNESCGICTPPGGGCIALACDPDPDPDPEPEPECGAGDEVGCGPDETCCRACPGEAPFCAGPGEDCPTIACEGDSCSAQIAQGSGLCAAVLGVRWTGTSCEAFSGCSCVGSDCDETFESVADCEAVYGGCEVESCGGFGGIGCSDPDDFCSWDDLRDTRSACGVADHLGYCMPRPTECADIGDPVCGCDGVTYGNPCEANLAGISVGSSGRCED